MCDKILTSAAKHAILPIVPILSLEKEKTERLVLIVKQLKSQKISETYGGTEGKAVSKVVLVLLCFKSSSNKFIEAILLTNH